MLAERGTRVVELVNSTRSEGRKVAATRLYSSPMSPTFIDKPIGVAWVSSQPEFADHKGVRALFGLSRAHAYQLIKQGQIRSVCIRRQGATRGRRFFNCQSIRDFLNKHADHAPAPPTAENGGGK